LTSRVGRGHESATIAVTEALGQDYEVVTGNFMDEILSKYDIFSIFSRRKHNAEDVYCFCVKRGWNYIANFIYKAAIAALKSKILRKYFVKNTISYLKKIKPDLVISVIGYVNYRVAEATTELKIPFIIIPTDLDQAIASCGFEKNVFSKKKEFPLVKYTISFKDDDMLRTLKPFIFPTDQIEEIGFPLRKQFFEPKNIVAIKNKWKVPLNKPVITLIFGGLGNNYTYSVVKKIFALKTNYHVVACISHNEPLRKKLEKLRLCSNCSITIVHFVEEISELVALADVIVIKPGSNVFLEALTMKKPTIIDLTHKVPLTIEAFNCLFLKEKKLGYVLHKKGELEALLEDLPEKIKALNTFFYDASGFHTKLLKFVKQILP